MVSFNTVQLRIEGEGIVVYLQEVLSIFIKIIQSHGWMKERGEQGCGSVQLPAEYPTHELRGTVASWVLSVMPESVVVMLSATREHAPKLA